jgi:hypothetical protein
MVWILLILTIFELLAFAVVIFFFLAQVLATFTTDAPFVPIPDGINDEIIENLNLTSGSILYDLGCGDARVLIEAVKKYPNIKAVGIEKAFLPYFLAKFYTRKYRNIEIKREDIFKTDISSATHIFVYLYPKVINRLINDIKNQCKKNTKIISCDFELDGVKCNKIVELNNSTNLNQRRGKKLFIYENGEL